MEEARIHLYREMNRFGWDLEGLESAGSLGFVDATPLRLLPEKVNLGEVAIDRGDFSMMTLIQAINKEVERIKPKRIVVDPITSLIIQYPEIVKRRGAILDLVDALVRGAQNEEDDQEDAEDEEECERDGHDAIG